MSTENNVTYIRNWFLENNPFLKDREDKEEMLHLLAFYVVVYEKFENMGNDKIIKKGNTFEIISGEKIENEEVTKLLQLVNFEYANLEYEDLLNQSTYRRFFSHEMGVEDGELDYEWLSVFETSYEFLVEHLKNYNYNKYVYKINNKVFYSVNELNEQEIALLSSIPREDEQLLWEVFHDGERMFWY